MIEIISSQGSPRLNYICDQIFKNWLGVEYKILAVASSDSSFKIHYKNTNNSGELIIHPQGLLFENDLRDLEITSSKWNDIPTLFPQDSQDIPFDIFSAVFYLITRYEEYTCEEKDQHGRFQATSSIAFKNNFLEIPVIDLWMEEFKKVILKKSPEIKFKNNSFSFISTIDVDSAYAYLGKGLYRTIGGFVKDIFKGNFKNLKERLSVLLRTKNDPFDTYDEFDRLHRTHNIPARYFFLLSDYGPKDINLPHWSRRYRKLIRGLKENNKIGIHPGFVSNFYPEKLQTEIHRLSHISNSEISHSRQHYLILNWPETMRQLIEAGITNDYTLGYADQPGFRAGTSRAFNFYDLKAEQATKLTLHPFAVMDATLCLYLELTPEEAIQRIQKLIREVKRVNGTFISCWHNESLSETIHWKGWKKVFEGMISEM